MSPPLDPGRQRQVSHARLRKAFEAFPSPMLRTLELDGSERVLDIGCGSGYQAALLSRLAREEVTVEIDEELAKRATALAELGGRATARNECAVHGTNAALETIMRLPRSWLSAALLCFGCSPPRGLPPEDPPRIPPIAQLARADARSGPARDCVRYWAETRYRSYAYDHVVHLGSDCHRVASCTVATNLNPTPVVVAVTPGEHMEVVTSRGSALPEFTPKVECSLGTR